MRNHPILSRDEHLRHTGRAMLYTARRAIQRPYACVAGKTIGSSTNSPLSPERIGWRTRAQRLDLAKFSMRVHMMRAGSDS